MFSLAHLHAAVVHFPIALLFVGSAAALLYLWGWRRFQLASLSWITMGLGWVATFVAILTGLLAQSGLPPQAPYQPVLNWHIGTGIALAVVYATLFYRAWLFRQRWRQGKVTTFSDAAGDILDDRSSRLFLTLLLGAGIVLVAASGWYGGQLVYVWGVNVLTSH